VIFEENSLDLVVNGVFIIFGTITFNNQVDVGNSGNLLATGNITFTGGQGDYDLSSTGGLYSKNGTVSGNGAPSAGSGLIDNYAGLENGTPEQQQLFNFVEDGGNNGPLPVDLLFFQGNPDLTQSIVLSWATASEENFEYFEIAHSLDGKDFEIIGTVAGNGNTSARHDYSFHDPAPYSGLNYYRLKSIDYDGYTEIFPLVAVQVNQHLNPQVFPNPSNGSRLNFKGLDSLNPFDVEIISLDGKRHYSNKGILGNSLMLNQSLSQGLYIVNTTIGRQTFSQRLIIK
jgi:hypothetical protein